MSIEEILNQGLLKQLEIEREKHEKEINLKEQRIQELENELKSLKNGSFFQKIKILFGGNNDRF